MGQNTKSTVRDRQVGARLRALRERAGFGLTEAAVVTGLSKPTLSRTETGKRRISTEDVAMITTGYRIPVEERQELIEFLKSGDGGGWWERPLPGVPEEMGVLASYEAEATTLTDWSVLLVPGLLQTEDYARAVWHAGLLSPEEADRRWAARRRRQQVLTRVDYTVFLYQGALRIPFGGPTTLRHQIEHLLAMRQRGAIVRLVREGQGLGLLSHSWHYMTFPNVPPVVNVEVYGGGFYLQNDRVDPYKRRLSMLENIAVSTAETSAMLGERLKEIR